MAEVNHFPACKALLICDRVIVDAATHHETYINCFEKLRFRHFPHKLNHLIVVAHIEGGHGDFEFAVHMTSRLTGETIGEDIGLPIRIDHLSEVGILTFHLYNMNLAKPGGYDIKFTANSKELMRRSLNVMELAPIENELQIA